MKKNRLDPIGVSLQDLPRNETEWGAVPHLLQQEGQGVLVVENLDVTGVELEQILEQFASALGHVLLPYDRWPGQSPGVADCTKLALLGNYKARRNNDIVEGCQPGERIAEYKPATLEVSEWHTDGSFLERPKTFIALYAPMALNDALPAQGGETRFCSTKLSDAQKAEFAGWTSVHSWTSFMRFLEARDPKRPKVTAEQCAAKPDQTWPLVTPSGHLYINPKNTKAVYDANGQALENPTSFIQELAARLLQQNGVYWHKWKPGQLVLWDNQILLHAATPFDASRYERLLYRAEFGAHYVPCRPENVKFGYLEPATPVKTVASGGVVVVDTVSASMKPPIEVTQNFSKIPKEIFDVHEQVKERLGPHILTGPIAIEGAQPGDVLQIDILKVRLRSDWAYTLHKPSMQLRHSKLSPIGGGAGTGVAGYADTPWGSRLECHPFFGVLGVATHERVSSVEPSTLYGGNLDLKKLTAGSTLYLPVQVPDALLYVGDGHARQGDGECCGTALETSLTGTFRLTLHKNQTLRGTRAETETELISIAVETSVDEAVKAAIESMMEWIQELCPGISAIDANCLCSIAGDLAVTQVVNGSTRGAHMILQKRHLPPSF